MSVSFLTPLSNRSLIKSTTSWLDIEFQIPSQAKTMNSSLERSMSNVLMSGSADIICSVGPSDLFCL